MSIYTVSTGLALVSTLLAGYKWYKMGVSKPNLIAAGIICFIPAIQWFWLLVNISVLLASDNDMNKVKNRK